MSDKDWSKYDELRDAIFWSWRYRGFDDLVEKLAKWLQDINPGKYAVLSDWVWTGIDAHEWEALPNDFNDHVWSLLVQLFGNYGTAPRVGWVERTEEAAKFLWEGMERTWLRD